MTLRDRRPAALLVAAASAVTAVLLLGGCAPEPSAVSPDRDTTTGPAPSTSSSDRSTPTPTATPVSIPTDCRGLLTESVLSQLADVPLNDPGFGESGLRSDGSLACFWGDPSADTGRLWTTISGMSRGPALDLLNGLVAEGFTCYTPDGGTRCEKVWVDPQFPVNDGRTLFWRDDVLVDTQYVGLAPSGYTDAVIAEVFG